MRCAAQTCEKGGGAAELASSARMRNPSHVSCVCTAVLYDGSEDLDEARNSLALEIMGSLHSHPRVVSWAAQDGRVEDLVYHLQKGGKNALKPSALSPKQRAPIHLAAIGGHSQCVKVLFDAGRGAPCVRVSGN